MNNPFLIHCCCCCFFQFLRFQNNFISFEFKSINALSITWLQSHFKICIHIYLLQKKNKMVLFLCVIVYWWCHTHFISMCFQFRVCKYVCVCDTKIRKIHYDIMLSALLYVVVSMISVKYLVLFMDSSKSVIAICRFVT